MVVVILTASRSDRIWWPAISRRCCSTFSSRSEFRSALHLRWEPAGSRRSRVSADASQFSALRLPTARRPYHPTVRPTSRLLHLHTGPFLASTSPPQPPRDLPDRLLNPPTRPRIRRPPRRRHRLP